MSYGIRIQTEQAFALDAFFQFVQGFHQSELLQSPPQGASHAWRLWGCAQARNNAQQAPLLCAYPDGIALHTAFGLDNTAYQGFKCAHWMLQRYACTGSAYEDDWPAKPCAHDDLWQWLNRFFAYPYAQQALLDRQLQAHFSSMQLYAIQFDSSDQFHLLFTQSEQAGIRLRLQCLQQHLRLPSQTQADTLIQSLHASLAFNKVRRMTCDMDAQWLLECESMPPLQLAASPDDCAEQIWELFRSVEAGGETNIATGYALAGVWLAESPS